MEWKLMTGDENLQNEIERVKSSFDSWHKRCWPHKSREVMLSEDSPVKHVALKMTKTLEEIKEIYPNEATEKCDSCNKIIETWIEANIDIEEYGHTVVLCKKCVAKMGKLFK